MGYMEMLAYRVDSTVWNSGEILIHLCGRQFRFTPIKPEKEKTLIFMRMSNILRALHDWVTKRWSIESSSLLCNKPNWFDALFSDWNNSMTFDVAALVNSVMDCVGEDVYEMQIVGHAINEVYTKHIDKKKNLTLNIPTRSVYRFHRKLKSDLIWVEQKYKSAESSEWQDKQFVVAKTQSIQSKVRIDDAEDLYIAMRIATVSSFDTRPPVPILQIMSSMGRTEGSINATAPHVTGLDDIKNGLGECLSAIAPSASIYVIPGGSFAFMYFTKPNASKYLQFTPALAKTALYLILDIAEAFAADWCEWKLGDKYDTSHSPTYLAAHYRLNDDSSDYQLVEHPVVNDQNQYMEAVRAINNASMVTTNIEVTKAKIDEAVTKENAKKFWGDAEET